MVSTAGGGPEPKPLEWVGSAKDDLQALPKEVKQVFGYALHVAQIGGRHPKAKALHGFGSAGVLEIVEDVRGDAYRAIYTVRYAARVYVLHVFQKKSTRGSEMPKRDMELIRRRLKVAAQHAKELES